MRYSMRACWNVACVAVFVAACPGLAAPADGFLQNGVTAHRGNSNEFPENTLPAFRSAIALGADWIETDIYRTRDGRLVVSHDKTTERVGNKPLTVADSTYAELRGVDVATRFRTRRALSLQECPPQRMPLLEDVLRLVMTQRKTRLSLQPKMDCVADAITLIKKLDAERWVGFNDGQLTYMRQVKRLAPKIPVFWDRYRENVEQEIATAKSLGFETIVLHHTTVTPARVAAIRQAGIAVGAWTVNDPVTMRRLLALGVTRIYTDATATLLALKAGRVPCPLPPPTGRTSVRLLTIGNSFSVNATRLLPPLVASAGRELIHHQAMIGGSSLAQHWNKVVRYEKEPRDPQAAYSTKRTLHDELRAEKWDFVTIQQYSLISHDATTYGPYDRWLRDYIAKLAPQAELLVHQTWAYRADDPRFTRPPTKPGTPTTQFAMYRALTNAYEETATELGLRMLPVGDAFFLADSDSLWRFQPDRRFDPATAQFPALPQERHSLHVGWQWKRARDGKRTLRMDGHHANLAGEYLGACVFYEMLFDASVLEVPYVPAGLDAAYARFLRETAHRAVQRRFPTLR